MSHIGTERDWDGLVEFYFFSRDYAPTLKRITIAQWILTSRKDNNSAPGTSELAINAINFAGLTFNDRMEAFGAGKFNFNGQDFCSFDDVEHFIDGYFHFLASGNYPKWHLLADRPIDFISHLQEQGFSNPDDADYVARVKAIYDNLQQDFGIDLPEVPVTRHIVSHGEFTFKIAQDHNVPPESVFRLEQNGSVHYGSEIGILHSGDLLYVLTETETPLESVVDPLAAFNPCDRPAGDCAGRTHFVIHQTVDGTLTKAKVLSQFGGKRNKAHGYILKSGEIVMLWPLTEKNVIATKSESPEIPKFKPIKGSFPAFPIRRKLIHIETDYEKDGHPTEAQYRSLAQLYIEACQTVGRILTIVPHIEIDRGIRNGHNDPQNFDYNHFYEILSSLGINIARIPKFAHDRYWGKPNFKTPFDTDTFHFPPVLSGNPHA